jgi:hypothetical protein
MSGVLLVTDDGVVVDFFHVWVKGPTSIALSRASSDGKSEEGLGPPRADARERPSCCRPRCAARDKSSPARRSTSGA